MIYKRESGLRLLLARGFSCYKGEKRSECEYSRVFSTIRTAKRSTKKFPKCFLFGIEI